MHDTGYAMEDRTIAMVSGKGLKVETNQEKFLAKKFMTVQWWI